MSTNVIPAVSPDAHCASSTSDHREILDLSNDTLVNFTSLLKPLKLLRVS